MRNEFISQFRHIWRMLEKFVNDFSDESWHNTGYKLTTPGRLAFHILQSTKYYINDTTPFVSINGNSIESDCPKLEENELPSRKDIVHMIHSVKFNTEEWIQEIDFKSENNDFRWTGNTMQSVVLYLIRHSQFHIGEISALLNEQKKGEAPDHFADTL